MQTRPMARRTARRAPTVARQVLVLQLLLVLVVVAVGSVLAVVDARATQRNAARDRALDVAEAVADSPALLTALRTDAPSVPIQPFAERVRRDTGTDFVVVMAMDRTRYSHPDVTQIGKKFIGDLGGAPQGRPFTQQHSGTLGPSMRAVVPVFDGGRVVAMVAVGITLERIGAAVTDRLVLLAVIAAALLAAGSLGAWLIARRLRRQTHGLGEQEITRMYEYYDAVLHAVREGLVVLDRTGRVQLVNDEAVRLLDLPPDVRERTLGQLDLPPSLAASLADGHAGPDELHLVGDRVLVVNQAPATWDGHELGSVATFRDHTELRAVSGELDSVRSLAATLRAQTHEASNRLHTVVSLIELGRPDDAVEFAVGELGAAQSLADRVQGMGEEPVVAALLLGKSAQAAERGVALELAPECRVQGTPLSSGDLVTVVGNLVDNALDAVSSASDKHVVVRLVSDADTFALDVEDSGPGLTAGATVHAFELGWSTKAGEDGIGRGLGLALVAQAARRYGGTVDAGRSDLGGARFSVRVP